MNNAVGKLAPEGELLVGQVEGLGCNLNYDGLDIKFWLKTRLEKTNEKEPDFDIYSKSPRGKVINIGAGWQKRTKDDKPFISLTFKDSSLPFTIYGTAFANDKDGGFTIVN